MSIPIQHAVGLAGGLAYIYGRERYRRYAGHRHIAVPAAVGAASYFVGNRSFSNSSSMPYLRSVINYAEIS